MEDDLSNQDDKDLMKALSHEQENQTPPTNHLGIMCDTNNQLQKESNSSKNDVFPTYKKRSGTNDAGKEFEYMMCALYALKLCNNKEIIDFKITTNNEKYGDFDDISLEINTENETKTFLLQLKHKENEKQYITNQKLISAKSEFTLTKYLESFEKLNVGDVTCLVYTNNPAKLRIGSNFYISAKTQKNSGELEERKINVRVKEPQLLGFLHLLQNEKNPIENDNIFQFDITQEETTFLKLKSFCESFYLMTGQDNVKTVKETVRNLLTSLVKVDIYDSFVFFVKEWWSGRFVLMKRDVISKLVELAMSPWIQTVSSTNVNSKTKLLSTGIMNFDMTVVEDTNNDIINNIWEDTIEEPELGRVTHKYHIQKNGNQRSKILWILDKVPLIVKVDSQNQEQVEHSIELLECLSQKKKLVLVGNVRRGEFPKWQVLENLEDLCCLKDIYDKIIGSFRISLQGRKGINLEELIRNSEDFAGVIEIDDLLRMTQQECLKVGNVENSLPESHIPRKVLADCVKTLDLLNDLQRVKEHVLIINCPANFKIALNTRYASVMELDKFLGQENVDKSRNLILLSVNEACTYSKFDSVRKKLRTFQVHVFQTVDKDCYIRLMGTGDKKLLGLCRNMRIDEAQILNYFKNQLNVIFAPPGMGKSTLFDVLYRNCPPDLWVVHVKLIDYNSNLNAQCNEDFLRYFMQDDKGRLYTKLSNVYLKNKKILILLDGVDELESQNVNLWLERSKFLASQGFHVWVSSRENYQEKISQHLKLFTTVNIVELTEDEQKDYIEKRLKKKYDSSDIKEIVDAIFESSDVVNSRQLLGIPLQLFIITENFLTNENLLSTLKKENIFVLTTMYKFFFEGKKKFLFEKTGMNQRPEQIGFSFKHHLKQYEVPSLRICLDDETFKKLDLNEGDCQEFLEDIKTKGDKFGIIKNINAENTPVFFHQTYAEYFACVWFTKNLHKLKLLREEWFLEKYENLRLIFDVMLSEQRPLHLAVIYKSIRQVRKYVDEIEKDSAGRNAVHLACCYGMKYPLPKKGWSNRRWDYTNCYLQQESEIYVEIVHLLLKRPHNIFEEDTLFGMNCINYALSSRCLYIVEACLKSELLRFEDVDKLLKKYYTTETLAFYASQMDYIHLLENVLERFHYDFYFGYKPSILREWANFVFGSTLLDVAIVGSREQYQTVPKKENIASVKIILEHKNRIQKWKRCEIYHQLQSGNFLRLACYLGCYEIIKILSTYQTTTLKGDNILHMTVQFGSLTNELFELAKTIGILNQKNTKRKVKGKLLVNVPNQSGCVPLMFACEMGQINYVELLLKNEANVNVSDSSGNTVLHYSARASKKNEEVINTVVKTCMDINKKNDKGETALHLACQRGIFFNVKSLIVGGSDINTRSDNGNSCLHYAAECYLENIETIKFLIDNNLQVNSQNNEGNTPLNVACKNGLDDRYNNIKIFLENGADVNNVNKTGECLLHQHVNSWNYSNSNFKILGLLLSYDVEMDSVDLNGNTALHLVFEACTTDDFFRDDVPDAIEMLLEKGADPNIANTNGENVLHKSLIHIDAIGSLPSDFVLSIIGRINDINARDNHGRTALHLLLYYGTIYDVEDSDRTEIAKNLLEAGADVNISDNQSMTPLHCEAANSCKNTSVLSLLVKYNGDCNLQNKEGQTPLHLAVKRRKWTKVKFLLENGADSNVMDDEKMTVLHYVMKYCYYCNAKYIKLLLHKGVKVNLQNKNGETALHLALERSHYNTVSTLIELDADMQIVDYNNENVLHHAMKFAGRKGKYEQEEETEEVDGQEKNEEKMEAEEQGEVKEEEERYEEVEIEMRTNLLKMFIHKGVNINAQNVHGESPLHLALQNQNSSIVKFLLQNGANLDLITVTGRSMLHYAAESCYHDNETLLVLCTKFDENAQDVDGTSILHCACKSGQLKNIKILISKGANIHVTDNNQQTILHYAAMSPHPEEDVMNYLVKTGIDIYAKNSDGKNALDVAFEHKCFRAVQLLIETKKFFDPSVSWSKLLYYSAFSGCYFGIFYWMENGESIDDPERNKHFFLEFLEKNYLLRKNWLMRMTRYAAKLIETFGVSDPIYGYEPLDLLEYIKLNCSAMLFPMNDEVPSVNSYRRFIEDKVFDGKK